MTLNEDYSNKFDKFERILQARVINIKAKINLHSLHCKSHCQPLPKDTCIKSQNIKVKRRRAKQPIKTDILRVEEDKAAEAKAKETDDVDQYIILKDGMLRFNFFNVTSK